MPMCLSALHMQRQGTYQMWRRDQRSSSGHSIKTQSTLVPLCTHHPLEQPLLALKIWSLDLPFPLRRPTLGRISIGIWMTNV